jgi:hypothetical protein
MTAFGGGERFVVSVVGGVRCVAIACALFVGLPACNDAPREQAESVSSVQQAWHNGIEDHPENEPAFFDLTIPLCTRFFGDISRGFTDSLFPTDPANTGAPQMFMEPIVRESAQDPDGGYHNPGGFGFDANGNNAPSGHLDPTEACVAQFPDLSVESRRQQIHCSCVLETCKLLPDEDDQIDCTFNNGVNYRQCFADHLNCNNYFAVEAPATGAFPGMGVPFPERPQAEISAYWNDQAHPPTNCGHEHALLYAFIRPSPGDNYGWLGSFGIGTNGMDMTGTGYLGCIWTQELQLGFGVDPLKVDSHGLPSTGVNPANPGGLRIFAMAASHGSHSDACGFFGCAHPVGVRVDYSWPPQMSDPDDVDQFWIEPNEPSLPSNERRTVGDFSQAIPRAGQVVLVSQPLAATAEGTVGDDAIIDVFVPKEQEDPSSVGQMALSVSIPSAGISTRSLGVRQLTGLPTESWSALKFALGADVRSALRVARSDVVFTLNVTLNSNIDPTLVDNFRFSGNLEQVGQSPVARCRDVTLPVGPSCGPVQVTTAMVDAGSSDPNGDPITMELSPSGPFGLGTTTVTLRVIDGTFASRCEARVTVTDTTRPSLSVPANVSVKSCTDKTTVTVGQATATDDCASITPTGAVVASNGTTLTTPIPVVAGQVQVPPGLHTIRWTASDSGGATEATQTVRVSPAIQARESFLLSDRAVVRQPSGVGAALLNSGTGLTRVGNDARPGGIYSVGAVQVLDRAVLSAGITSAGSISVSPSATVPGPIAPFSQVLLPALPALPAFPAPVGPNLTVNSGSTLTLSPGSRPSVTVNSGGTLILGAGDYYFRNLTIFANATVRAAATTRIFVRDTLTFHSPIRLPFGSGIQTVFLGFAGASLTLEAVFNGTLLAPNAAVSFGIGSGLTYSGAFYGRVLEVRPQSTLVCLAGNAIVPP